MSNYPVIRQPESSNAIFTLMPDEYIRFEYNYKPGCCCFTSKITTVTNKRLITHVIKTPGICSKITSTGKKKNEIMYVANINNIKQIQSAIPSSQNKWWMNCLNILTCAARSNEQIDWLELCRGVDNLAINIDESTMKINDLEKF